MHHTCMGSCGGSSEEPGVCTTEGCDHKNSELKQCDCADGKHGSHDGDEEMSEEEKTDA